VTGELSRLASISILNEPCRVCLSICSVVFNAFIQFSSDLHGISHGYSHVLYLMYVSTLKSPRFLDTCGCGEAILMVKAPKRFGDIVTSRHCIICCQASTGCVEIPEIRSRCLARDGHCGVSVDCALVICFMGAFALFAGTFYSMGLEMGWGMRRTDGQNVKLNSLALELIIGSGPKNKMYIHSIVVS
jgi:hypothetical protein